MAAQGGCKLSYDTLVAMIPFVMDFLDIDSEDVIASGLLDDDKLDDAAIALILSHQKARNECVAKFSSVVQSTNDQDAGLGNHISESETSENIKETKTKHEPLHSDLTPSLLNTLQIDSFRSHFRMNEDVFQALMQDLVKLTSFAEKKQALVCEGGGAPVSFADKLMLTLQFLGSRLPVSQLAASAGMTEPLYGSVVQETMEALYELLPHYILWPDENQAVEISNKFRQRSGLQGVLGTIDVLHVPVTAPEEHVGYYTNQHDETTVLLQSVCDHRLHFIHCCTGWPGSMEEDVVLKDSDLYNDIRHQVSTYFPFDSFLVGDEAYCLTPWLMTPFEDDGSLSTLQQQFNSACHQVLQDNTLVYSLLMQRFPRLENMEMKDMQSMVVTILVCCALHNFCLDNGDEEVFEVVPVTVRNINSSQPEDGGSLDEEGERKRQHVLQLLKEL